MSWLLLLSCILIIGLKELLEYSGDDIEETFMQTFSISYKDVFGVVYNHELKAVFYTQIIQNYN